MGRIFLVAAVAGLAVLGWVKRYALDEFQYSHAAWLVSQGKVPHRDFFEFHFALPYEALSLLWWTSDPQGIRWLRLGMVAVVALALWAMARLNRDHGVLAPVLAVTAPAFVLRGIEIRPDPFAFALYLLAVVAFGARRAAVSGALLGLAVLSTQKVLLYGAPFLIVLLLERKLARRWLAGLFGVLATQALFLVATGSASAWWQQTWVFALEHERAYPGFSAWRYLGPALKEQPGLFTLGAIGLAVSFSRWRRERSSVELLLMLSLGTTLFSFCFARAPFPYALVPFAGMAALFAARTGRAGLVLGALVIAHGLWTLRGTETNTQQHEVLAKLGRLTAPTDPVWDSSGGASARPHVGFRFYTNALIHEAEAKTLGARVASEIREAGCTAALRDVRFEWLPADAREFVTTHFQPYDGDIRLWGQRIDGRGTFEAVRTATYFVEPPGPVRIDGELVTAPTFVLQRGMHEIEGDVFVLWLPASGERWRPDFDAKPVFSSMF